MRAGPRTVFTVFGLEPLRIGGVESFAREFSLQLGARGWRSVLCFAGPASPEVRAFLDLPNVTLETLPGISEPRGSLHGLRRLLRQHRPEVLLLQFTPFLGLAPWVARFTGVRRIVFIDQGSHPEGWVSREIPYWKRQVAQVLTRPLDAVVSISDYNLRSVRSRRFVPEHKTTRIYNAANTARGHDPDRGAAFRARHGIGTDRIVASQASWMIPEKGIPDLLEAVRQARQVEPRMHLMLAGEGPRRAEYQVLAAALGLEGHVTWTGLVRDPLGEGLFDAADVVCQMSRWEEAFGYVIAEAMAVARPVLATRVGAIPELVVEGETGFLVERGDSAGAAGALVRLAGDPAMRARLGEAGRQRARQEFDVERNVGALVRLLGVDSPPAAVNGSR